MHNLVSPFSVSLIMCMILGLTTVLGDQLEGSFLSKANSFPVVINSLGFFVEGWDPMSFPLSTLTFIFFFILFVVGIGLHCVTLAFLELSIGQTGLKLTKIHQPLPPEFWV